MAFAAQVNQMTAYVRKVAEKANAEFRERVTVVSDKVQTSINNNPRVQELCNAVRTKVEVLNGFYQDGVSKVTETADGFFKLATAKVDNVKASLKSYVDAASANCNNKVMQATEAVRGLVWKACKLTGREDQISKVAEKFADKMVSAKDLTTQKAAEAKAVAQKYSAEVVNRLPTKEELRSPQYQAATVTAVGGAAVGGTSGAAVGLISGGTVGAVVGLVPAIFTFGLSIPIFAAIGGTCGAAAGAVAGGSAGFVGGAGAGYGAYQRKDKLGKIASDSASFVRARFSGTTGGTD